MLWASTAVPTAPLDVAAVYREHFDFVLGNLRRLGVPAPALEDACHDVFLVVHRRARSWDSDRDAMRPWLYGVARRVAADLRRSGSRHRRRVAALQAMPRHDAAADERIADRHLVQSFLDELDDDKRDVFILVELEDMSAREVADALGINPNTASARLRAARRLLAERLQAVAATEHEARILAAARRREASDANARARVWIGLLPALGPTKGVSTLVASLIAGAAIAVTTAVIADSRGAGRSVASTVVGVDHAAVDEAPTLAQDAPRIEPAVIPAAPVAVRATPSVANAAAAIGTRARADAASPIATTEADRLQAQTELAGRVLRASDPALVLQLVDEYRTRFGDGFFADRLTARRIEALCSTDSAELATREHAALVRRQPALANRALAGCRAAIDHESEPIRPSGG